MLPLEECPLQGWEDFAQSNMPDVAHMADLIPWLALETANKDMPVTEPAAVAAQILQVRYLDTKAMYSSSASIILWPLQH